MIHLRFLCQVGVTGIRQIAPLGPVTYRVKIDVDQHTHFFAPIAIGHHLFDVLEEFEFIFNVFGREHGAVKFATAYPTHVFHAVDNFQVPLRVDKAGIIGVVPAVCA